VEYPGFDLHALDAPAGINTRKPHLETFEDGRSAMSWTEKIGANTAVRMAVLAVATWSVA
jgi:hypothetical protein|tara:strand:- start:244 stop:423 length:180 start_codon:yes stop_codon:yes gene_type:complete